MDEGEARIHAIARRYGSGVDEVALLFEAQQGACAICAVPFGTFEERRFRIDHDHATGVVRGLLCHPCNIGLGFFRDNETALSAAVAYLARVRLVA